MAGSPQPMSFWDDFIGAVDDVVSIGSKVLPIALALGEAALSDAEADPAEPDYPVVGNVAFYPYTGFVPQGSGVVAYTGMYMSNISDIETNVVIGYAGSSVTQCLAYNLSGNETIAMGHEPNIFGTFDSGKINVSVAQPTAQITDNPTKILSYTVAALGLAVAAKIFPGFTVTIRRGGHETFSASIANNSPANVISTTVRVSDGHASGTIRVAGPNQNSANAVDTITLPSTLDLINGVAELDVTVEMPSADFDKMFAYQRKLVRKTHPRIVNAILKRELMRLKQSSRGR